MNADPFVPRKFIEVCHNTAGLCIKGVLGITDLVYHLLRNISMINLNACCEPRSKRDERGENRA
jgi:hypothetical protein